MDTEAGSEDLEAGPVPRRLSAHRVDRSRPIAGHRISEWSKESPAAIPGAPYASFQPMLETGDLVFFAGRSPLARLQMALTKSPWSHVGILVRIDAFDRIVVLESVPNGGVRLTRLGRYLGEEDGVPPYDGDIVVARHVELDPRSPATDAMIDYGMALLNLDAGLLHGLGIAIRTLFGLGSRAARQRAFTSAEFVEACFSRPLAGGFRAFFRAQEGFVSPADLWTDPCVMPLRRLVRMP
ncbi:MAG: hypothetical protein NVS9B10_17110 [Nevskia sp.]